MNIVDYDKIEIIFEEFSIILPANVIEKLEVEKVETLIEAKYNPEDNYNVYIVINRPLAEKIWEKTYQKDLYWYETLTDCVNNQSIYNIKIGKGKEWKTYSLVWSYTEFTNEYQRIGIIDDKIMIRIKEM